MLVFVLVSFQCLFLWGVTSLSTSPGYNADESSAFMSSVKSCGQRHVAYVGFCHRSLQKSLLAENVRVLTQWDVKPAFQQMDSATNWLK